MKELHEVLEVITDAAERFYKIKQILVFTNCEFHIKMKLSFKHNLKVTLSLRLRIFIQGVIRLNLQNAIF